MLKMKGSTLTFVSGNRYNFNNSDISFFYQTHSLEDITLLKKI